MGLMIDSENIGIVYNPNSSGSEDLVRYLRDLFGLTEKSWIVPAHQNEYQPIPSPVSLVITIGGDGTILWTTQITAPMNIPILGINLGRVGFMTELEPDEVSSRITDYLGDGTWIEERSMLQAKLISNNSSQSNYFHVLNEVVIGRNTITSLVHLGVRVDGIDLTTYRSDALIISTATGSTGYALSAGGPILHPQSEEIIAVPVAPHMSMGRSVVLPKESIIDINLLSASEAVVSLDGRIDITLEPSQTIQISRSPYVTKFLRVNDDGRFYGMLNKKLKMNTDSF